MREEARHFETELAVIGSGIAGFAASVFALKKKIDTAQVGNTGAVAYTTGYLDLLGSSDESSVAIDNPWDGLLQLKKVLPRSSSQPNSPKRYQKMFRTIYRFSRRVRHCLYCTTGH